MEPCRVVVRVTSGLLTWHNAPQARAGGKGCACPSSSGWPLPFPPKSHTPAFVPQIPPLPPGAPTSCHQVLVSGVPILPASSQRAQWWLGGWGTWEGPWPDSLHGPDGAGRLSCPQWCRLAFHPQAPAVVLTPMALWTLWGAPLRIHSAGHPSLPG